MCSLEPILYPLEFTIHNKNSLYPEPVIEKALSAHISYEGSLAASERDMDGLSAHGSGEDSALDPPTCWPMCPLCMVFG